MQSKQYFQDGLLTKLANSLTDFSNTFGDRNLLEFSQAELDSTHPKSLLKQKSKLLANPDSIETFSERKDSVDAESTGSSRLKKSVPQLNSNLNFFRGNKLLKGQKWKSLQTISLKNKQSENLDTDLLLTEQHLLICGCSCCQFTQQVELADVPAEPTVANSSTVKGGIPALSSNPNAKAKIYLDFDGHTTSGTWWNTVYNDGNDFTTPAYSLDDSQSFSSAEAAAIEKIWQRVAEDYAPFNVDVTTINPGNFSGKTGLRVVIGGSSKSWLGSGAGGIALVNSWRWNGDTPAFVFEQQLGNGNAKYVAEAVSHEVGHTLGLYHQSRYDSSGNQTEAYHSGSGKGDTGWAPIMGQGYKKNLTTWHNGSNSGGAVQDDLSIIASSNNGFGYRADDHGDTNEQATVLAGDTTLSAQGIISQMADVDVFSFMTGAGTVNFDIDVAPVGANLDVVAELWDDDSLLVKSNPSERLDAQLEQFLEAGTYHIHIKSNGEYGRLGQYTLSGTIFDPSNEPNHNGSDASSSSGDESIVTNDDMSSSSGNGDVLEIGEVGQLNNLTHSRQTILLEKDYINPVVFANPLSRNGKDPSIVRIDDIQSDRFTVQVQEPNYKDGTHTTESFSYLVVEAGTWQLADGRLLEVGTFDTNATTTSNWASIDLAAFDQAPVVLSQVQTSNDSDFVRLRQKNIGADSFQVALEKEEALKSATHGTETVGWMAFAAGQGNWNGLAYQAGYTGDRLTHNWSSVNFDSGFTQAPQLLASIATFDGSDAVGLRYQSLGKSGVQLMLEEDASHDKETKHTTEDVGFLALEGSGMLTAQAYNPLNAQVAAEAVSPLTPGADTLTLEGGFSVI